jgi:hypothetical protein
VNSTKQVSVIKSVGTEIAERILASADALNARQEVRITLKKKFFYRLGVLFNGRLVCGDDLISAIAILILLIFRICAIYASQGVGEGCSDRRISDGKL